MRQSITGFAQRPSSFPWPPALLGGAFLGAFLLGHGYPIAWPWLNDAPARALGTGLVAAGVVLFAWAAIAFKRHRTTILPNRGADRLVTDGPFRVRRNPIYLADVLILLGLAELTSNLWFAVMAALFAVLVTWLAILPEEHHLEAKFGDAYRDYKANTRRWI
jgi:protein-S-isoprenylcysteine O-methyltransferase Ste14